MDIAYLVVTLVLAAMAAFSGLGKLRRDQNIVDIVHKVVGVPLQYFPYLAACECLGAFGLILGIWWPFAGIAAGIGLVLYFVGAIVSHVRVGDMKGIGPAAFMLTISIGALALRVLAHTAGIAG